MQLCTKNENIHACMLQPRSMKTTTPSTSFSSEDLEMSLGLQCISCMDDTCMQTYMHMHSIFILHCHLASQLPPKKPRTTLFLLGDCRPCTHTHIYIYIYFFYDSIFSLSLSLYIYICICIYGSWVLQI